MQSAWASQFRLVAAEQLQHQPADRIGRARAIVEQCHAVGVAGRGHVLTESRQQRAEAVDREAVSANRRLKIRPVRRRPRRGNRVEFAIEGLQGGQPVSGWSIALVGEVVGGAGEAVDGAHGRPQAARHQHRRDGKVFVVADPHALKLARACAVPGRRLASIKLRRLMSKARSETRHRASTGAIAKVAKLVDAPGLGPDAFTGVGVRVPPFAPHQHPAGACAGPTKKVPCRASKH